MGKRAVCQCPIALILRLLLFTLAAPKVSANALPYSWGGRRRERAPGRGKLPR